MLNEEPALQLVTLMNVVCLLLLQRVKIKWSS
jgi:hypothetical protein